MKYIKNLKKICLKDISLVGGKATNLGEVSKLNENVPDGFVILSSTFEKVLGKNIEKINSITDKMASADYQNFAKISKRITKIIVDSEIPKYIELAINNEYRRQKMHFVAVRSSATMEDGLNDAWAGQLETFLNTNQETLFDNIKKCWASLYSSRALQYRHLRGADNVNISIAVIVQKMIQSRYSGVSFSINPVTLNKNQIIIEVGMGLGEAIVSGKITPDAYHLDKKKLLITEYRPSSQNIGMYLNKKGNNYWKKIENNKIDEKIVIEIGATTRSLEKYFGYPVDIEWGVAGNKIYIMQCRPITAIK